MAREATGGAFESRGKLFARVTVAPKKRQAIGLRTCTTLAHATRRAHELQALVDKLRAYAQQDRGADTVDAQTALGLPVDAREYAAGAAILHDLGAPQVVLLTNNPKKVSALRHLGLDVVAVERLHGPMGVDNERYLVTKRERMGHDIPATGQRHGKETA